MIIKKEINRKKIRSVTALLLITVIIMTAAISAGGVPVIYGESLSAEAQPKDEAKLLTDREWFEGTVRTYPVYDIRLNKVDEISVRIYDIAGEKINFDDAGAFFDDVAKIVADNYVDGLPAAAVLAQAYTEGGAGKSGVYIKSNNLFGITASSAWEGYVLSRSSGMIYSSYHTARMYGQKDLFRVYPTMQDSVRDYLGIITGAERYREALGKSNNGYLKCLVEAGYGEKNMVGVWMNLISHFDLEGTYAASAAKTASKAVIE